MDSEYDSVVGVYSEAKFEYSRQLSLFILPVLTKFFFGLLDIAKEDEVDPKKHVWAFQNKLSQIPEWNQDKVLKETAKIQSDTGCDYLEELLTAVFIAHTKVLSSIRLNNRQKKLQISIPKIDHFLHRTLSECSRVLWSSAYLFHENISSVEKQKNLEKINNLINESIMQAVRSMLPVKNILREYLSEEPDAPVEPQVEKELSDVPEVPEMPDVPEVPEVRVVEAPEPAAEPAPEPVPEPAPEPVVAAVLPPVETEEQVAQIIIPDTEQSVRFADYNTVFSNNGNTLEKMLDEDDGLIKFDENEAPVALTEFEDLENPQDEDILPIEDYETL